MRKLVLFLTALLFGTLAVVQAQAQNFLPVTAASIYGGGNVLLPSGTLIFQPVDANGNPVGYQVGGGGQQITWPTVCSIVNGAIAGSCQLANVSLTNPINVCFSATIKNSNNQVILGGPQSGYTCVQPQTVSSPPQPAWCTGGTCNFDQYVPNLPAAITALIGPPQANSLGAVYARVCGGGLVSNGVLTSGAPSCVSGSTGAGNVVGPSSSTVGDVVLFNALTGQLISDAGFGFPLAASHLGVLAAGSNGLATSATTDTTNAANISSGTLPHGRLPVLLSADIPANAANTSGTAGGLSANIAEAQVNGLTADLGNRALAATTVNGHPLSANVVVSAADLTTGVLPHPQLPTLVGGDIPANSANTTGTAGGLAAGGTIAGLANGCLNVASNVIGTTGIACGAGSSMVYPALGIPISTGSAWGASLSTSGTGSVALTGSPVFTGTPTVPGYTPTTTTVNTHPLSSNVVVSASDLTTGILPHPQLPTLLSADIPANAANTSGTAANLSGTPTLPNGTVLPGYVPTTVTVNTHPLSSNVVVSASDLTTGTLPHPQLPILLSADIPANAANTSGTAANLSGTPTLPNGTVLPGYVPTTVTVNGHALSSNVTVSASDLTTGTLPHAQLPAFVSGDIPANAANTSGTAANLSGTPALPNGVTVTTQAYADGTAKPASDAFVLANAFKSSIDGSGGALVYNFNNHLELGKYAALSTAQVTVTSVIIPGAGTTVYATMANDSPTAIFTWPTSATFQFVSLTPTSGSIAALNNVTLIIATKSDPTDGTHVNPCVAGASCNISFTFSGTMPTAGTYALSAGTGSLFALWHPSNAELFAGLQSSSTNPAKSGWLRLAHADQIKYRNNGTIFGGADLVALQGWGGSGDANRLQLGDGPGTVEIGPKEIQDSLTLTKSTAPQQYTTNTLVNPCAQVANQSAWCFEQTTGLFKVSTLGGAFALVGGNSFTAGLDLSGTSTSQTVIGIRGTSVPTPTSAGALNWTGSAWNYLANITTQGNTFGGANQLLQLDAGSKVPLGNIPNPLTQSTSGNAATATALAATPTGCSAGNNFSTGITANGTSNCANVVFPSGSGGGVLAPVVPLPNLPTGLSLTAASTVGNTVTPTSLLTSYVGYSTIRAGQMLPTTAGLKTVHVHGNGKLSTAGAAPTLTVTTLLGGVTLAAISVPVTASLSATDWELDLFFTVNGLTTAQVGGCVHFLGAAGAMVAGCMSSASVTGLNFAANQAIDEQVTWGTANASNTITANQLTIYPEQRI